MSACKCSDLHSWRSCISQNQQSKERKQVMKLIYKAKWMFVIMFAIVFFMCSTFVCIDIITE